MSFKKFLEMDSQGYKGRRDAPVELGGPETTVKPDALETPDKTIKDALQAARRQGLGSKDKPRERTISRIKWFRNQPEHEREDLLYQYARQGTPRVLFKEYLQAHVEEAQRAIEMGQFPFD